MTHLVVDRKNLEYAHSPLVTNLAALLASDWLHHLRIGELAGLDSQRAQFGLGKFTWLFAVTAQATDESLRHNRAD